MYVERVNLLCTLAGISPNKLAIEIGVTTNRLKNYIKGQSVFDKIVRDGILQYFDLPEKILDNHEVHLTLKGDKIIVL